MSELTNEILKELAKPFPANKISIKVQTKPNDNGNALCVAYIDARDVMERLDSVVGGAWSDDYRAAPSGGLECALTVMGVTRRDVGDDKNDNETEKAGYSDAFKRAAVKFGIGRFLYDMPKMFAKVKQIGKNYYLADGEEDRLRGVITRALNGEKPNGSKPAESVQLPQSSDKGKVAQELKPNEVITDADWEGFERVRGQALSLGVKLPEYDRSKMTAATLNGAKQYIIQQISKKEGK